MKSISLISGFLLFSHMATAFLEVRGIAGFAVIDPHTLNKELGRQSIREAYVNGIIGGEALIFPVQNFGVGVRYDWQGIKTTAAGQGQQESEVSTSRWSAVAKLRYVGLNLYAGIVGTAGFQHSPKWKLKTSAGNETTYDRGTVASSSAGVEGGFMLGPLIIGGETGFQSYLVRELKTADGQTAPADLNLGGWYLLGLTGFHF